MQRRARAQSVAQQSLALPSFRANSVDSVDQANRLVYAASFRQVDYESDRTHMQEAAWRQRAQGQAMMLISLERLCEMLSVPR